MRLLSYLDLDRSPSKPLYNYIPGDLFLSKIVITKSAQKRFRVPATASSPGILLPGSLLCNDAGRCKSRVEGSMINSMHNRNSETAEQDSGWELIKPLESLNVRSYLSSCSSSSGSACSLHRLHPSTLELVCPNQLDSICVTRRTCKSQARDAECLNWLLRSMARIM